MWLEHVVEEVNTEHREGNKGSIEGPYYVPEAPEHGARGTISMRDDEGGTPLTWSGRVTSTDGSVLDQAKVELWHADDEGLYSQFAPGIPEWNLRGTFSVDADGEFEIRTVRPAPYRIPTFTCRWAGRHACQPAAAITLSAVRSRLSPRRAVEVSDVLIAAAQGIERTIAKSSGS